MSGGECQTKNRNEYDDKKDDKPIKTLDEGNANPRVDKLLDVDN